jgi:hypothetical protein
MKGRELIAKRSDSGFRRNTLGFDPLEVRLCFREFGDEWVTRRGRRTIPRLFFVGRFHSKVSEIQLRIASQARAIREGGCWSCRLKASFSELRAARWA